MKTYTFDVRVTVKAEGDAKLPWIKHEVREQLSGTGTLGFHDGFAVYGADGQFEITAARGSRAYEVADWALKELESWIMSEYQGTPQLGDRLAQIARKRHMLGKARD